MAIDNIVIPGKPEIQLPVYNEAGKQLSLCLIEIGCKPRGKSSQLKDKRELLFRHFKIESDELFNTYRGLVYFNGVKDYIYNRKSKIKEKSRPDFTIHYRNIPRNTLENIKKNSIEKIIMGSKEKVKRKAGTIIRKKDTDTLYKIIISNEEQYHQLKGKFTEYIFIKDIERNSKNLNRKICIYTNPRLNVKNKRYKHGTEIDLILAFYNDNALKKILGRLKHKKHIDFSSKTGSYDIFKN